MAKLLLVEDDNNLREIYEARLQAEGYQIVSARDGEEALVIAKAEKPDLVISDVMMPKISGFEMLDILRNTDGLKQVKVIMLTALGQSDDQKRADKLGADRYLVKSQVTLEDIVKTAHELLGDQAGEAETPAPATEAPAPETATPAPAPAPEPAPEPAEAPVAAPAEEPKAEQIPVAPAPAEPATPAQPAEATPVQPEPAPAPTESKPEAPAPEPVPAEAAKSTVQEEADVEAKIEDFVTGASSEPTAPAGGSAATPASDDDNKAAVDQPPAAPAPAKDDATTASDDKLMEEAVDQLVASTGKVGEAGTVVKPEPAGSSAPSAPTPKAATSIPVNVAEEEPKPAESAPNTPETPVPAPEEKAAESGGGSMTREKVIQPPADTEHKKGIKELLAEEEARETQSVPGAVIAGSADGATNGEDEDKPSGAPSAAPSDAAAAENKPGGIDPNSIAL